MSKIFDLLAERRINDAIARGELDDLPGQGKALEFDDDLLVSPEQRMVNRVLKNAGFTPREILLRKQIAALREELAALAQGERREAVKRELMLLLIEVSGRS